MSCREAFKSGDYIEVTPTESEIDTFADWGVLRGTAVTDMSISGSAIFTVEVPQLVSRREVPAGPLTLTLNANFVDVRLLFSASRAREGGFA